MWWLKDLLKLIIMPTITVVAVYSDFADYSAYLGHVARHRLSSMFVAIFIADAIVAIARSSSTAELVTFGQRQAAIGPRGFAGRRLC